MKKDHKFLSNGRAQKKEKMKEDHILMSNGHVQIKEINRCGP